MDIFLQKIAQILEVDSINADDDLKSFSQWDSLAVLSVIAMLDADYGVNLRATDLQQAQSASALWSIVQTRKAA